MSEALDVKDMKLYAEAGSILADLEAMGYANGSPLTVDAVSAFDQLHYHGADSVRYGVGQLGIDANGRVLEIGAGWGGPSRVIAAATGARVVALELQPDFHSVGESLTARCGLADLVSHQRADFLTVDYPAGSFDHAVSWLALYHIPDRAAYTAKIHHLLRPGGMLFIEDLMQGTAYAAADAETLNRELFSNSMVSAADYVESVERAGFEVVAADTMTQDWRAFTTERLAAFDANRAGFIARHSEALFEARRHFYAKIVEYFTADAIGGMRLVARKR